MKIPKLKFGNSVFSRLVVTFLIIMIPIYMLGIYIYNWGLNTVKNEISKSTIAQASFYLEGLEKEFERMKILQYDCLNDDNLNKLAVRWAVMDQYDINESVNQLRQRLVAIENSSTYIKNVSAHILTFGKTISSNNGLDDFDTEKYQGMEVSTGIKGAQIIRYKEGLFLSTFQQGSWPLYVIEIELNQEAVKRSLARFYTDKESGSFLVSLMNNGSIIAQSDTGNTLFTERTIVGLSKENGKGMKYNKIANKGYYITYVKSDYLNMVFIKYIPQELIQKPLQNFYIWVWVFTMAAVCIMLIYSLSTYKLLHKPLLELVKSFGKVESGDLKVSIHHDSNDEFGYLYKCFNDMVRNLNTLIDQVYNQKILMQRAELKQLQSQINPHFLYNSFFTLNTMARIGDENLVPFTKHLGEYFRFITRNSSDYVPLPDEINHAKTYTEIQSMRFSKRLQIRFEECPEKYKNLKVPRLILQPVIENAFEHGFEKKKSDGILSVSFEENEEGLDIIVEDNGSDMGDTQLDELRKALENHGEEIETTGIINIHRRMKLVFGENSGLTVSRSEMGGLMVKVKIKIPGGDKNVQIAHCG